MKRGKLVVIGGPMFSGKTTYLIKELKKLKKQKILVVKPKIDNRYYPNKINAHNGKAFPATTIDRHNLKSIINLFSTKLRFLFVDEINFWSFAVLLPQINFFLTRHVNVFAAGLFYDFRRRPFGATLPLSQKADEVKRLFAVCDGCGAKASFNYRKENIIQRVVVSAGNLYGACCKKCYPKLNKAIKTKHKKDT